MTTNLLAMKRKQSKSRAWLGSNQTTINEYYIQKHSRMDCSYDHMQETKKKIDGKKELKNQKQKVANFLRLLYARK